MGEKEASKKVQKRKRKNRARERRNERVIEGWMSENRRKENSLTDNVAYR